MKKKLFPQVWFLFLHWSEFSPVICSEFQYQFAYHHHLKRLQILVNVAGTILIYNARKIKKVGKYTGLLALLLVNLREKFGYFIVLSYNHNDNNHCCYHHYYLLLSMLTIINTIIVKPLLPWLMSRDLEFSIESKKYRAKYITSTIYNDNALKREKVCVWKREGNIK